MLILTTLWASHASARELSDMSMVERHEEWMAENGRVYKDAAEKARRFEIFKSNAQLVDSFNAGNHKYWLGMNKFADLTNDEFKATRTGFRTSKTTNTVKITKRFKYENVSAVPASMDWRTRGVVTPVKDQGQCGVSINLYLFNLEVIYKNFLSTYNIIYEKLSYLFYQIANS